MVVNPGVDVYSHVLCILKPQINGVGKKLRKT